MFVRDIGGATILHADLDAFFAAVEQRDNPALRGRPIAVGGGVVMCASYEARARGVRGAMGGGEAKRLCPDLLFVEPRLSAYTEASRAVFEVFNDTTPFVEGISVDEAFLDVGGLRRIAGTPEEIAVKLRQAVRERVDLPISVGVARTKFLAKVASAVSKPDGLLVVAPDRELAFLHPLPIERIWGVGAKTAAKLHARGVHRVGDIAAMPEAALVAILGPGGGHHIHALAHNRDARRVQTGRRRRSIGSQRALGRMSRTFESLDAVLVGIVDRVTHRLRDAEPRRPDGGAAPALRELRADHAVALDRSGHQRHGDDPRGRTRAPRRVVRADPPRGHHVGRPHDLEPVRRSRRAARPALRWSRWAARSRRRRTRRHPPPLRRATR